MPIKKPFLRFRTRSLLPPEKAYAVTDIETEPRESGGNPNINKLITFTVDLPLDELYCPVLQCEAYDFICKGVSQPKIGSFTINLGEVMHSKMKEKREYLNQADKYIQLI